MGWPSDRLCPWCHSHWRKPDHTHGARYGSNTLALRKKTTLVMLPPGHPKSTYIRLSAICIEDHRAHHSKTACVDIGEWSFIFPQQLLHVWPPHLREEGLEVGKIDAVSSIHRPVIDFAGTTELL